MKKQLLGLICSVMSIAAFAKDGYKIEVTFKQDMKDEYVYLAHYYAKPLPTIYKTDSAKVINKRKATIESKDSTLGGIYMLLFDNRSKFTEFILQNGDQMSITVDTLNMPENIAFKGSPENDRYLAYEKFLVGYGKKQQGYLEELKKAKNAADTQAIRDRSSVTAKELLAYRNDYIKKYPGTFLTSVFNALNTPEVPEGKHYLAGTKTLDSNYSFNYYKTHYWDKFDFTDNRLMNTPVYDAKLDEYFNRLVIPLPDTMNMEADLLLAKTRKSPELFKYSLHWLTGNAERSKVMGMDESFVYLVEKYYMRGDAFWLDSAALDKYTTRAKTMSPTVIGNKAPDLDMQEIWSLQERPLSKEAGKYTMVVFWSKECGHCMKELPQLDSLYNTVLKKRGVKVYTISTEGDLSDIQKVVEKLKIKEWTNVVDANNKTDYRKKYDVYTTPKVFLLDESKTIIGKGLDHTNVVEVLDFVEKKKAKKS